MKNHNHQSKLPLPKWLCNILKLLFPNFFNDSLSHWQVWKSIEIGTYLTIEALEKAITLSGGCIDPFARPLLNNIEIAKSNSIIDLVKVTPLELGFSEHVQYHKILQAGLLSGLKLCPAEVGPLLHILNVGCTQTEDIYIAMQPIALNDETFEAFALQNRKSADNSNERCFLTGASTMPVFSQSFYPINTAFVFVKDQ